MRIVGGTHRGRKLLAPGSDAIRPTAGRVREAVFFLLGDLTDTRVVDAYAGSGALGCEALSRGAGKVWFFDRTREAIDLVRENVARIDADDRAVVMKTRFERGLRHVDEAIDLVFLDPPYGSEEPIGALRALADFAHFGPGALVVLEQRIDDEIPEHPAFEFDETREYGGTRIAFFYRRQDPSPR